MEFECGYERVSKFLTLRVKGVHAWRSFWGDVLGALFPDEPWMTPCHDAPIYMTRHGRFYFFLFLRLHFFVCGFWCMLTPLTLAEIPIFHPVQTKSSQCSRIWGWRPKDLEEWEKRLGVPLCSFEPFHCKFTNSEGSSWTLINAFESYSPE